MSKDIVSVRLAVESDISRLIEIRALVHENRLMTPGLVTRADYEWFVAHGPVWVAEGAISSGGRTTIQGFAAGDPRHGTVWALFVDPMAEGRGIGQRLLAQVCETLQEQGHSTATLTTAAGTRAETFYRAGEWTIIGRTASGELRFQKSFASKNTGSSTPTLRPRFRQDLGREGRE